MTKPKPAPKRPRMLTQEQFEALSDAEQDAAIEELIDSDGAVRKAVDEYLKGALPKILATLRRHERYFEKQLRGVRRAIAKAEAAAKKKRG